MKNRKNLVLFLFLSLGVWACNDDDDGGPDDAALTDVQAKDGASDIGAEDQALSEDTGADEGEHYDVGPPADAEPDGREHHDIERPADAEPDLSSVDLQPLDITPLIDMLPPVDTAPLDAAPLADIALVDLIPQDSAPPIDVVIFPVDLPPLDAAPDAALPPCERDSDCLDGERCLEELCVTPAQSPLAGILILNEVLIDGRCDEDANGDGDVDRVEDEFIEIVHMGQEPVDLSGCSLVESNLPFLARHRFPEGFTLEPGQVMVIFGGGEPSEELEESAPDTLFLISDSEDPAFNLGLNLDDAGDRLRMLDANGDEIFLFAYGDGCLEGDECLEALQDRAYSRVPDLSGEFLPHPGVIFSPGTQSDGEQFP